MQHLLFFHYGALLIPPLYYGAIRGTTRLLRWRKISISPRILFSLVFFAPIVTNFWIGPYFHLGEVFKECRRDLLDEKRDLLLKEIPKEAPVMATFEFLPHLTNRRELYSFHYAYTRKYTLSKKDYPIPESIQYLLVDFNDPLTHSVFYFFREEGDRQVREFLKKGSFKVVRSFQDIVLFKRGEGEQLFRRERSEGKPNLMATDPDGKIGLSRWHAEKTKMRSGETLPFVFEWYCIKTFPRCYGLLFEMVDREGKKVRRQYHSFCYRIYPTERWQKGEKVTEKYQLVLPPPENGRKSTWTVALYLVDEKEGRTFTPFIRLGDFEVAR